MEVVLEVGCLVEAPLAEVHLAGVRLAGVHLAEEVCLAPRTEDTDRQGMSIAM